MCIYIYTHTHTHTNIYIFMCYQTDPKFRKSITKTPVLYRALAVQIRFRSNSLRILKII